MSNSEDAKLNKEKVRQMLNIPDEIIESAEERATISNDYKQRLTRIIEEEGKRMRKAAEHESAHIVARAREGYRQRLSQFLEEEVKKIRRQAEQDAADIISKALEKKEHIIAEAKIEAQLQVEQVIREVRKLAEQEAAATIDHANDQAMQITAGAKERAKKQAEREKRREVKRIIEYAKQESAEIIAEARQVAEKEVNKIIADAMKEAEERSSKIIALAKQKAVQLSGHAFETRKNGGEDKLAKLLADARRKSEWTAELIAEAKEKARHTINEAEENPAASEAAVDKDDKVDFMSDLADQHRASPSDSARSIWDAAMSNAERILGLTEPSPEVETKEEDEILAPDRAEAEELSKEADTAGSDQVEETVATAEEPSIEAPTEVAEETAAIAPDKPPREEEDVMEGTPETAPTEKDSPAEVAVAEVKETPSAAEVPKKGEVEILLGLSVDSIILTKLHNYLTNTPGIKVVRTLGSGIKGATIIVMLDKPIPLVDELSSTLPEAEVTSQQRDLNSKRSVTVIYITARRS